MNRVIVAQPRIGSALHVQPRRPWARMCCTQALGKGLGLLNASSFLPQGPLVSSALPEAFESRCAQQ
jgi:hypothetical protein